MDTWKYFDITHREHRLCNPTSLEKLDRLIRLLRLPMGARVVDIATGKAEFLLRLLQAYGVTGHGVDLSPFFIAQARDRLDGQAPGHGIELLELDGARFEPDPPESYDLASCLGASWIWSGHRGTLEALARMARPGGWVVVGEPYWIREPSPEYLEASGCRREDFGTHYENVATGEALGLRLATAAVSNLDDWDTYEGLQWYAAEGYGRTHPDDPDLEELTARVTRSRDAYLRWGRDTLGWAIYCFRRGPRLTTPTPQSIASAP